MPADGRRADERPPVHLSPYLIADAKLGIVAPSSETEPARDARLPIVTAPSRRTMQSPIHYLGSGVAAETHVSTDRSDVPFVIEVFSHVGARFTREDLCHPSLSTLDRSGSLVCHRIASSSAAEVPAWACLVALR
ncbi:hypothetical protein ACQP2X_39675 [Actinoplanes sp. CA-131856]